MRFVYPWLLLLLSIIPLVGMIWLWLDQRAQQRLARLVNPALQNKLMPIQAKSVRHLQFLLVFSGLTLLIFAAARPQWGRKDERVITRGRNLIIALDVSRSMLATDVHPNRLERAKTDIMDLIEDLDGDRAALLAFRNKGSLLCPLTTDYAFLRQALDGVTPESAARGETDLGDAIRKSLEALDPALDEYNAILLISDGEDLKGDAVSVAKLAGERNIPIFTVGIGDGSGSTIPDAENKGVQKFKGQTVQTKLVSETLHAIAAASKSGRYIPLGTAGTALTTLGAIYRNHLRQIAAQEQQELIENRYQERFQLFLIPAIFCLLAAAWTSRGRFSRKLTRRTVTTIALLFLTILHAQEQPLAATNEVPKVSAPVVAPGRAGARLAQSLFKKKAYLNSAETFLAAARGADPVEAEIYRYNAAYAYSCAQDITNAVQTLRPLLSSRRLGSQAGELLGKLLVAQAHAPEAKEPGAVADALGEASTAFQTALRETPDDARCIRNLSRAVTPLAAAREQAHIAQVMEKHGKTPPDQLMNTLLAEQREIMTRATTLFTNEAPSLIAQAEALAERQKTQADLWIPLKSQLLQAVTNQQQQAMMAQQIELARDSMTGATAALKDLKPEAVNEVTESEPVVYGFWKALAAPESLVGEGILCQSNAIQQLNHIYLKNRDSQTETLQLTRLFQDRFPQWADQYIQQNQSNTNLPPFTPEDKAKIEKIAAHAEKLQKEIVTNQPEKQERHVLQEQALEDLIEIRDLLPKNPNQNQSQNQQQQPQQKQQQQQPQDQPKEQEQKENEPQKKPEEKKQPPQDVQETLRRALEREKEHEDEKKERMRKIPLSPSERDW